jgi:hypothetical protein
MYPRTYYIIELYRDPTYITLHYITLLRQNLQVRGKTVAFNHNNQHDSVVLVKNTNFSRFQK